MSDVLLLHAGIADRRMWEPQVAALGGEHRVIAFDLPGFGSATPEPGRMSFVDYVAERLEAPAAAVVELVQEITIRSYELQMPVEDKVEVVWPEPRAATRLGDVRCPTLVVVGDRDVPDLLEIADMLAISIPGARKAVIEGAGHLPSLERPDELNRLLLDFLR